MPVSLLLWRRLFFFLVSNLILCAQRAHGFCAFTVNASSGQRFPNTFWIDGSVLNQDKNLMLLLHDQCALVLSALACIDPICVEGSTVDSKCQTAVGAQKVYFCQFGELRFIWDKKDTTAAHQCVMTVLAQVQCDGVEEQLDSDLLQSLLFLLSVCAVVGGGFSCWHCWCPSRAARLDHRARGTERQQLKFGADMAFLSRYGTAPEETAPELKTVEMSRC